MFKNIIKRAVAEARKTPEDRYLEQATSLEDLEMRLHKLGRKL